MPNRTLTPDEVDEYVKRKRNKNHTSDTHALQDQDFKGYGIIDCRICSLPVRDHRIGPCPFAEEGSLKVSAANILRGGEE